MDNSKDKAENNSAAKDLQNSKAKKLKDAKNIGRTTEKSKQNDLKSEKAVDFQTATSIKTKTAKTKRNEIKTAKKSENNTQKAKAAKPKIKKLKVLFVCTGNTCRSPMAEQLFKHFLKKRKQLSMYDVSSAGLYADPETSINAFAIKALTNLGVKAEQQSSRQLTEGMAEGADLIVCMTSGHKMAIDGHNYIFAMGELTGGGDVPDPYGADVERYIAVARYLEYACADIYAAAEKLRSNQNIDHNKS